MADGIGHRFVPPHLLQPLLKSRLWPPLRKRSPQKIRLFIAIARLMVADVKSLLTMDHCRRSRRPYQTIICFGRFLIDMNHMEKRSVDYQQVERAIGNMKSRVSGQPSIGEIAKSVGLSDHRFQRLFSRWSGVAPERFFRFLTDAHARRMLDGSGRLLTSACDDGLLEQGQLHELVVTFQTMTPGMVKGKGRGMKIHYGIHPSPFGPCLHSDQRPADLWIAVRS